MTGLMREQTSAAAGARGLTAGEVLKLRGEWGTNRMPVPPSVPTWRRLANQLVHFFALMLWVASVLAFVGGMPQLGVAIALVVVLNGVFAFMQESRTERAAERLRDLLPRRATVVRDGVECEIDAVDLVPGDRVILSAGDRVCADIRCDDVHALLLDTSMLTGESVPVSVAAGDQALAGTFIVEGDGAGAVVATGARTRLSALARMAQAEGRPPTPLALELHKLVRTIALVAAGTGVAFFGITFLFATPASEGFLFAIGVTVALVPEGLLPTMTLSLAMGAQRMAARHALVRRLESVETLGSTTFICTDKTGTLTRNQMVVVSLWTPAATTELEPHGYDPVPVGLEDGPSADAVRTVANSLAVCSRGRVVREGEAWEARGDPLEAAFDVLARRLGIDAEPARQAVTTRFPFDARRRRMSVVDGDRLLVKGAPDAVLPRCSDTTGADQAMAAMTARGLRVLAVAARSWKPAGETGRVDTADSVERDLELLGLVGVEDPPRDGVSEAVAVCRRAGIRLAMVTGDHPDTARAIADEVGLRVDGAPVVTGAELPDDPELLGALVDRDGIVLARIAPEDKLRIAQALQGRGHVVAMTGDGVNDAPALQQADIGIAMGRSGTDVAREAADLVLLDDNFATIVVAIREGRATFANIRRFLTYHLTDNVAELTPFVLWALTGGHFPLALGVLQILALDLGTDTLPAVALGAEQPSEDIIDEPPVSGRLLDRSVAVRAFGVLGPTEAGVSMLVFGVLLWTAGWRPGHEIAASEVAIASGGAFFAVIAGQAANVFACRSTVYPAWHRMTANRFVVGAAAAALLAGVAAITIPLLADVLDHAPPPLLGWFGALLAAPALMMMDALQKWVRRRRDG